MTKNLYIGLISGTSMDAIDCALVQIEDTNFRLIDFELFPFAAELRSLAIQAVEGRVVGWEQLGDIDIEFAREFAHAANRMMMKHGLSAREIVAIGCHGQTLWHQPIPTRRGNRFTWQLGDPNTICCLTGVTTVSDFRRFDMAAGGQGAPLVPAFHVAAFSNAGASRIVLNLGGIANITVMKPGCDPFGYDTGPANLLMDAWIKDVKGLAFDRNGDWASSGKVVPKLLQSLLNEPYFYMCAPKSTGRELFSIPWVERLSESDLRALRPEDVQATLLELTCVTIASEISRHTTNGSVLVCGGGANNAALITRLQHNLPGIQIASTAAFGIEPDAVEAVAFAWLAQRRMSGKKTDFSPFTGANRPVIAGGVYSP